MQAVRLTKYSLIVLVLLGAALAAAFAHRPLTSPSSLRASLSTQPQPEAPDGPSVEINGQQVDVPSGSSVNITSPNGTSSVEVTSSSAHAPLTEVSGNSTSVTVVQSSQGGSFTTSVSRFSSQSVQSSNNSHVNVTQVG